jgi:hypothetical protein
VTGDFGDGQFYLSHIGGCTPDARPCDLIGHIVSPWPPWRDHNGYHRREYSKVSVRRTDENRHDIHPFRNTRGQRNFRDVDYISANFVRLHPTDADFVTTCIPPEMMSRDYSLVSNDCCLMDISGPIHSPTDNYWFVVLQCLGYRHPPSSGGQEIANQSTVTANVQSGPIKCLLRTGLKVGISIILPGAQGLLLQHSVGCYTWRLLFLHAVTPQYSTWLCNYIKR